MHCALNLLFSDTSVLAARISLLAARLSVVMFCRRPSRVRPHAVLNIGKKLLHHTHECVISCPWLLDADWVALLLIPTRHLEDGRPA